MNKLLALKNRSELALKKMWFSLCLMGVSGSALADMNNDVTLDEPDSEFLEKIVGGMQDIIDAIGSAGVVFIVFVSAAFGIGLWVMAPKQSAAIGFILRVIVGGIGLFNLALLLSWLQS